MTYEDKICRIGAKTALQAVLSEIAVEIARAFAAGNMVVIDGLQEAKNIIAKALRELELTQEGGAA